MSRRFVIDPELRKCDVWPSMAITALPKATRREYLRREEAVRGYLSNDTLEVIHKTTDIGPQQLYNLLRRCLSKHPDGRIYGFRGLLQYARIKAYDRRELIPAGRPAQYGGAAGAMMQLLQRFPPLRAFIKQQIKTRTVSLSPAEHLRGLGPLHDAFLKECTALGIKHHQYPFNQLQRGKRALAVVIKKLMNSSFHAAARAAGAERTAAAWYDQADPLGKAPATLRPFEVAEFDGHKLDVRLRARLEDPFGLTYDLEIKRVWLLVILDVCTGVVLGWHVVLASEYDRYDVIKTMQSALIPRHKRIHLSIPALAYDSAGGFVSQVLPATEYACWDWLRIDNAKANLAEDTLRALTDFLGCYADAGPIAQPNERPYIERFFGTIESTLGHRLPGSTGSHPGDVRRRRSKNSKSSWM